MNKRNPSNYKPLAKAQEKYNKRTRLIGIRFKANEIDLYNYVAKQESKADFIKNLIKNEMKKAIKQRKE